MTGRDEAQGAPGTGPGRRHDIDWLRAGAVYLLLAYHSARPWDHGGWHVKARPESAAVDLFTNAIHQWHMPLLFTLAGWSIVPSLERRGPAALLSERRERVLVPFAFGCVAILPLVRYVEVHHRGEVHESFLHYLPSFFTSMDQFNWMHLWFLIYLYVFTLLYLPGFRWVRARDWTIERVPSWALYAAIVPLAAVQVGLRGRWPGYQNLYDDWANFAYYSLFFVAGFLLTRFPAIEEAVHRERRRAACAGAVALAGMVALAGGLRPPPDPGSARWVAFEALSAVAGACLVAAALGYGNRLLAGRERGLAYARDSAMPVYVLHQPIIILLAVPIAGIPAGVPVRLGLLFAGSTAATVAAYGLVRRSQTLLRLLGSKPARPSRSGAASRFASRAGRIRGPLRRAMTRS
jgi:glucan biosynthesis protein C